MTITSYAQNLEDIILWRALKHIDKGFYIDVGANDPNIDSVTNLFYKKGWNGINIEPLTNHYSDLLRERINDINLHCAAGSRTGEIKIWECNVRGWATADESMIERHINMGQEGEYHNVPISTLEKICRDNVTGDIHFLKIDVEGLEEDVIKGNNWTLYRPWIIVVESTIPNSQIENFSTWEHILLDTKYSFAYTDGINRFYVSNEHKDLLDAFKHPPNVFDDFILASQLHAEVKAQKAEVKAQQAEVKAQQAEVKAQQAEVKAQQAEVKAQQAEVKAQQAEAETQKAEAKSKQLNTQLNTIKNSLSWRMTAPLRWIKHKASLAIKRLTTKNGI